MNAAQCVAMAEVHENAAEDVQKNIDKLSGFFERVYIWEMQRDMLMTQAAAYRAAASLASDFEAPIPQA